MGLDRTFYRETVQNAGVSDGKIIRQRNGIGVYAHVRVEVRALSRGKGVTLAWNAGLNIPSKFVDAVWRGIQDVMSVGPLAGFQLTDVCASVEEGSYHEEDSTADAFREAAEKATREAILKADPIILESFSSATITVPSKLVTLVEAAIKSHGGVELASTQSKPQFQTLRASLCSSDLSDFIAELLQISDGRASILVCDAGFRPRSEPPEDLEGSVTLK